jgi:hypothetical protein
MESHPVSNRLFDPNDAQHPIQWLTKGATAGFAWCAQYDLHSSGESPPWAVVTGTIRLSEGVRREAGSEESR